MRKLSRREICLIYIAFLLLVFYVGDVVFGVPVKKHYEETCQRLETVQMENRNLERKLEQGKPLESEYRKKKEALKGSMARFGRISTGTGLEQYLLACFKVAGLKPVSTLITASGASAEAEYLSGSIEVRAEGSYDAATRVLDEIERNPALYVETYVLCPEEGTDLEVWSMTARITYWLPISWEEASGLVLED